MNNDNQPAQSSPPPTSAATIAANTDKPSTPAWSFGNTGSQPSAFKFMDPSLVSGSASNTSDVTQKSTATFTPVIPAAAGSGWSFGSTEGSEAPKLNFLNASTLNRDFPGSSSASSKKRREAPESDDEDPDRADRSNRRTRGSATPYERADTETAAANTTPVDKSHRQIKTPVSRLKKLQEQRRLRGVGAASAGDLSAPSVPTFGAANPVSTPAKQANPFAGFSFASPGQGTTAAPSSAISFAPPKPSSDATKDGSQKDNMESEGDKTSEATTAAPKPAFSFNVSSPTSQATTTTSTSALSFKSAASGIANPFSFTSVSKPATSSSFSFGAPTASTQSTESTTAVVTAKPAFEVPKQTSQSTPSPFSIAKPTETSSDTSSKPANAFSNFSFGSSTTGNAASTGSTLSFASLKPSGDASKNDGSTGDNGTGKSATSEATKTAATSPFSFKPVSQASQTATPVSASALSFKPASQTSEVATTSAPAFGFKPTSQTSEVTTTTSDSAFSIKPTASNIPNPFSFTSVTKPAATTSSFSFGTPASSAEPTETTAAVVTAKPAFDFSKQGAQAGTSPFSFSKPTEQPADSSATPSTTGFGGFGSATASSPFGFKPTASPLQSAAAKQKSDDASKITSTTNNNIATTASPFGTGSATSSAFGSTTSAFSFKPTASSETAEKTTEMSEKTSSSTTSASTPANLFGSASAPTFSFGSVAATSQSTSTTATSAIPAADTKITETTTTPAFSASSGFSFKTTPTPVSETAKSPAITTSKTDAIPSPFSFKLPASSTSESKTTEAVATPAVTATAGFSFKPPVASESSTSTSISTSKSETTPPTFSFSLPTSSTVQPKTSEATSTPASTTAAPAFTFKTTAPAATEPPKTPSLTISKVDTTASSAPTFQFKVPTSTSEPTTSSTTSVSAPATDSKPTSEFSFDKIAASIATTTPSSNIALSLNVPATSSGPTSIFAPLNAQQQSNLTTTVTTTFKPDTILKSTRYMELPDDAKHELDELERMVQVEVQICDYIKARKAAMDENVITGVRKEAEEMTKKLDALNNRLNGNMERIQRLLGAVDYEMRSASVAKIVVDTYKNPASGGKWLSGHNVHNEYFKRLAHNFEIRLERYRQSIAEIEMTVSSLAKGTRQSPQAIAEIMKYQNKSFIAVAGKVAAIHEEIEKLKELYVGSYGNKTIKLSATNTAGSAKKAPSKLNVIASTTLKPFSETFK